MNTHFARHAKKSIIPLHQRNSENQHERYRYQPPLVRHKLTLMREADCSTYKFRTLTTELARLMAYEASRDFEIEKYIIDGWCGSIEGDRIKGKTLTVVPILRAGLGMLDGVLDLIPTAKISVVGLQRDEETLKRFLILKI